MPPERRRGPYKRYLRDEAAPVPRQTVWNRRQANAEVPENEGNRFARESSPSSDSEGHRSTDTESEHEGGVNNFGAPDDPSDPSSSDSDSNSSDSEDHSSSDDNGNENDRPDPDPNPHFEEGDNHQQEEGQDEAAHSDEDNVEGVEHFGDDEGDEVERGPPLYQGCRLSRMESDLLIMSYIIRWGLEDKSIQELLQLIDCHLPVPVMRSQYLFLDRFPVPDLTKVWFTCSQCYRILPRNFEEGECEHCQTFLVKKKLKDDGNFFIELSVKEQLKSIVENEATYRLLRRECEENDVISGRVYQNIRARGICGDNDLTLQFNTDGMSPFRDRKNKFQAWPIQVCVNELPFHARRENMLLCGLYFGKGKPHFNSFLKPFIEELQSLHNDGFQCQLPGQNVQTTVKVHTFLASVDSVARPPLQGLKQFNGAYGCSFCLHRGMRIDRGDGRARVYAGNLGPPRTVAQYVNAIQELTEYNRRHRKKKTHVEGVKYASNLFRLSLFNLFSSFVPDYLHCILEGVVKQFMSHWRDSTYRQSEWYLNKEKRRQISQKLMAIKPPVEVTRAPKGYDDMSKAAELRAFLLYYSIPSLHGILPARYLQHWFLLVYGLSIYLKEKFTQEESTQAGDALRKFVEEIRTLYPDCIHLYTFNVHLILHLPHAIENFGGLWASSTFPYEHFNGVLSRLITGPRHVPEHICSSYIRLRQVSNLGERVFSDPHCSVEGKKLFKSLTSKYRSSKFSREGGQDVRVFGGGDAYQLPMVERVLAQQMLTYDVMPIAISFRRMIFQGTVYHASSYEALRVRNNSVVKLNSGRILHIKRILMVSRRILLRQTCVIIGEELEILDETLCHDRTLNISSRDLIYVCRITDRVICAAPHDIIRKCVAVPYGNAMCVAPLVNMLERD